MSLPTLQDIDVWRGNNLPPIEWPWPDGYVATVDCQLTIWSGAELLIVADGGGSLIVDTVARKFIWSRTLAESRMIPFGRIAQYEIEDRDGGETTIFYGAVNGLGGLNLDSDEPQATGQLDFSSPYNSGNLLLGWV
ncbi:hypothetical protein SAMN02745157_1543 [Kaistia soli DSM 19436]|uniref:Uncharacterized protein n=1 Tax=Kaistia soli DSM 19436 TaxID=1122133 RepID=A0A1M4YKA1_9HYPH|nr:hypothetical protein [Kaistia soli]SHF06088.1 hypothetical protein SAMN02745157_1543 [Kaistia soli DSM 19436]